MSEDELDDNNFGDPKGLVTFVSKNHDLSKVTDLISFIKATKVKLRFPFEIVCPLCENKYVIRALDDFPAKSIMCKCQQIYMVKLVKVTDGTKEIF